jgi:hypothetical protein
MKKWSSKLKKVQKIPIFTRELVEGFNVEPPKLG